MKRVFTILAVLLPLFLMADIAMTYDVEAPSVRGRRLNSELPVSLEAGSPALPYTPVRLLLPAGESVTAVTVAFADDEIVDNIVIDYARAQQPISQGGPDYTRPDEAIYSTDAAWPAVTHRNLGVQRKQGRDILLLNVYPYRWNPVRNELVWSPAFTIDVQTSPSDAVLEAQQRMIRHDDRAEASVSALVDNPETMRSYRSLYNTGATRDPEGPYTLVIITDSERESWFDDYVQWKVDQGVSTGVFTTEWIYSEYTGDDNADAVRNFIIDAYSCYAATDTPLEYVILGGDDEICPERGCFGRVGYTVDTRIPCDMYFSNLDGDWDGDNDGIYGEPADNPDMLPEIAIGRLSAETQTEFENMFNKNYYYTDNSTYSNDIAWMFGENLNNNPVTWGGDYKDAVSPYIPDEFHIFTAYEREGTFSTANVREAINNGLAIINHMGHCNETSLFGLNNSSPDALFNTEFGFAYSQGCYPAAFDERTSQTGECVAENLTICPNGLYAFVGNTRYGWYSPGSIYGASEYFDLEFFEALFDENIRRLGDANNYSKEQLINEALQEDVMRWVYYELIVLGDPMMSVKDANGDYPFIIPGDVTYDDVQGDGDGILNPGETVNIYIDLENMPNWANAPTVEATIACDDPSIQIVTATAQYGAIPSGSTAANNSPFVIIVPEDCNYDSYDYTITVNATTPSGAFVKSYDLSFDVGIFQSGWPWATGQQFRAAPIVYDIDGDSILDVLTVNTSGGMTGLDVFGQQIDGVSYGHDENLWRSTAFADLDGDDLPEVIWASRHGAIGAWSLDGTELFRYTDCQDLLITPVVADVDGDGEWEVMSVGLDGFLYVLSNEGELKSGFPVEVGTVASDICASDLDDDGAAEIILGNLDGLLYAFHGDGSTCDGFPLQLSESVVAGPISLGNGSLVVGVQNNTLQVVSSEGQTRNTLVLPGCIAGSVIAADFVEGNGAEIAFATQNGFLYICTQYGDPLPGWPVNLGGTVLYPPLAMDIDNDDEIELAQFTNLSNLHIFNADASELPFAPVPVNLVGNTPATFADMDGDGDGEFVCGVSSGAVVIDSKMQMGEQTPWPTFRGNLRRTGCYTDMNANPAGDGELVPLHTGLAGNWPNPFNPTTTVGFSLAQPGVVSIDIYNIRGQRVRTLLHERRDAGEHSVVWHGKDDNGAAVGSGVYFSRMRSGDTTDVSKMLLLK